MSVATQQSGASQQKFAPFAQGWIYQFIERYKTSLNVREYSILNNLLMHMEGGNQLLQNCSASDKLKGTSIKIINRIIKHAHTKITPPETQEQSRKAKEKLHL